MYGNGDKTKAESTKDSAFCAPRKTVMALRCMAVWLFYLSLSVWMRNQEGAGQSAMLMSDLYACCLIMVSICWLALPSSSLQTNKALIDHCFEAWSLSFNGLRLCGNHTNICMASEPCNNYLLVHFISSWNPIVFVFNFSQRWLINGFV